MEVEIHTVTKCTSTSGTKGGFIICCAAKSRATKDTTSLLLLLLLWLGLLTKSAKGACLLLGLLLRLLLLAESRATKNPSGWLRGTWLVSLSKCPKVSCGICLPATKDGILWRLVGLGAEDTRACGGGWLCGAKSRS